MVRCLIAAAALGFAVPAFAQDALPSDCLEKTGGLILARDMVDEYLAENGAGSKPVNSTEPRGQNAANACVEFHEIADSDLRAFLTANLGYMLSREMRRRMEAADFDLSAIDDLIELMRADPGMDVATYVDARPELFDEAATTTARDTGLSLDLVLALSGGYLGMKSQQLIGEAMLRGE